jgi:ParB family chromosome partitioning protein
MINKKRVFGLSKNLEDGISQTINAARNNMGQLRYEVIPLSRINLDPNNPRKLVITIENLKEIFSETDHLYEQKKNEIEKLQSLANSIKKVGVRHAVEVYKDGSNYNLISGERRILASILAEKKDIQARILDNKPSEFDLKLLQWIENIEREDLTPWERINNVKQLMEEYFRANNTKVTPALLGEILGCSRQHAYTLFTVLEAPETILSSLKKGEINHLEKAAFLARIKESNLRAKLLALCINGMSFEELKKTYKKELNYKAIDLKRKGRPALFATLGKTATLSIVKRIIDAVLELENYQIYKDRFKSINWCECSRVSAAFKELLNIMENKESKKGKNKNEQ